MQAKQSMNDMIKTAFVPIIVYYFVHQMAAMVLLSLVSYMFPEQRDVLGSLVTMVTKMLAMMLAGVSVLSFYRNEVQRKNDSPGRVSGISDKNEHREQNCEKKELFLKNIIFIMIAGAVFSLSLNYLFVFTGLMNSSEAYNQVANEQFSYALLPALCFYGVVSPMVEEMVFRGVVFSALKRNLGIKMAVFGSAFLFGAIHGNVVQMLYGTLMGIFMAVFYEKYDKLLAPILFHGAANIAVYICSRI